MLQKTTAQAKIRQLRKRVRIVCGGTSASKTFSIIPFLIEYALVNAKSEISVVAESIPHLRRGALRDFLKIMDFTNNYLDANFNKSTLTYVFTNGSYIEFFSADNAAKMRGARRDVLFINECNNVTWESYHQLAIRTRKFIYLDYNPVAAFWVDTELKGQPNTDFITLTYRDNEALEPAIVAEIEAARERGKTSAYWANWYNVYGLGQVGSLQGVVFDNWQIIDDLTDAKLVSVGVDFGYTNDPSAIISIFERNGQMIVDEVAYSTGMMNADIAAQIPAGVVAWCDSAEPKSIAELCSRGVAAKPVVKGKDSIQNGIGIIQQRDTFYVTQRSTNLIKELRGYCWEKDASGKMTNVAKGTDHAIDAMRYGVMMHYGHRPKIKSAVI